MSPSQASAALVVAGKQLLAKGLVSRSWGNLSLRTGPQTMAITPSGIPWKEVTEEMISLVDLPTGSWSGRFKPSGERKVHREIYLRRPEVQAIVHTHQSAASVCAAARIAVSLGGATVACAPYALPGTKKLTLATAGALAEGPAVLMANHGVFTVGANLQQAFDRAQELETACADLIELRADGPLPARTDLGWDRSWMQSVPPVEGKESWISKAPFTLQWSRLGRPLPALLDDLAQLAGSRVSSRPRMPPRCPANDLVFVGDTGLLVCGPEAETLAMVVEKAARAALGGRGLGGAKAFPAWEAELMRWVYRRVYAKQASASASRPPTPSAAG